MANKLTVAGILALGAGLGAGVALLYAPRAGKHTRQRIRKSANRALDHVRDDLQNRVSEWTDEAKDALQHGKVRVERYLRAVSR
jgi:gas vesicle protein